MSKRYIVTGGSGFIGSHIVDELINQNHTVVVIDNNSNNLKPIINQNASYYYIDISDINNTNKLSELFHDCDGVFHCAALIDVQDSIARPYKYEINNTLSTLNILQIAAELKVKRVIYSSSAAVYGNTDDIPISESNKIDPISPYGAQKYYGEVMCKMFSELYGLETCCLRYFNAFGERQKISGSYATVIGIFKYQILQNLPMTITGDGEQRRDFIYVKDLAKANIMAMTNKNNFLGETINLGSGENFSINQIAEFFGGSKKYIPPVKEPKESLADISKANEVLGWNPTTNIEMWIKNNL
jgi:UDP-glucose 4-epimerase